MADRISVEDFFRKPERAAVHLSPDGSKIAYLAPYERRLNIHVQDLANGEITRVTAVTERDLAGFTWVGEDRLLYARDNGGDENYRLYSVGADGGNPLDLTPFDEVQCSLVDDLEDIDDMVLFQMNRRDPERFDVYRLNTATGEMEMVAENPGNVQAWVTDHAGRLRVAVTTDGVNTSLLYRKDESDEWNEVARYTFKESASPLLFSFDDDEVLYVASNVGRDRTVIATLDLRTGEETGVLFEHPRVDVSRLLHSRHRRVVTGVSFEEERPAYHFFDETRAALQKRLDEKFPDSINGPTSWTKDETVWVVVQTGATRRARYHLYDTRTDEFTFLFDSAPWLNDRGLVEMHPIRYSSRDGLEIHGYLTVPDGVETTVGDDGAVVPSTPLPLVLVVHGGPWVRDSYGYDPEAQILANRGYAVLQVNYRGSTGYGRKFWEASFGQWGLAMQDDLTDAVRWAVDQGITGADTVAIYGGSYGGYAALSGVTKTPDLFRCGVSYVGLSNLFTWMDAFPPYWKPMLEMVHEMVGHPEKDKERMRKVSPLFNADKIQVPLFVAQGANDPRVRKEESDQIVTALRDRGVPVQYMVKENEGHGFSNEENSIEFYHALEAFLLEHLPPGN